MRRMGANAAAGETGTRAERESNQARAHRGAAERPRRGARRHRVRPAGARELAILVLQGPVDGVRRAARPHREEAGGARVAHHGLVAQPLHQLAADAGVDRRQQAQPQAGEPRGEHGNRHHHPPQPPPAGVQAHELPVGHAVGAADLHDAALGQRHTGGLGEVGEHVLDRDRLRQGAHPPGRHHHRQPVHKGPDHLERRAARSDDDRRPQLQCRHPRRRQGAPDLLAAGQVGRQIVAVAEPPR